MKIFKVSILIIFLSSFLSAQTPFFDQAIQQIDDNASHATTLFEKFAVIEDFEAWLKLLGKSDLPPESVDQHLSSARLTLEKLRPIMEEIHHYFHPDSTTDTFPIHYFGKKTIAYQNSYLNKEQPPHSKEKIAYFFSLEKTSYEKHKIFDIHILDKYLCPYLKTGIVYIYAITTDGKLRISKWQNYTGIRDYFHKIWIAPNHAILADGEPVVVAGEFELLGNDENPIWLVSIDSGHYRPKFSSRVHIFDKLKQLGVPENRIILTKTSFHAIPWKFIHQQQK